jgi:hypothetical protein
MSKIMKPTPEELKERFMAVTAKVAEKVELFRVWLVESSLKRNPGPTDGLNYLISGESEADLTKDPDRLFLMEKFAFKAVPRKKQDAKPVVTIQASFLLAYELKEPESVTLADCSAFSKINGAYNAWPYWREYVQSVTARMGLPSLTLPVFRLSDMRLMVGPGGRVTADFDQRQSDEPISKADSSKKGA